ncbi:radical SAM protein [Anaerosacchariphilus polymeriproducens]|uniref:Radical SAM protein n=1 Tax=Anaerosacchariphilus polymeriproducens TaxID=1812858 RepID=A0A371AT42_9FIRM|nr:radical SAM protein [Anaerosacchariphilus polymeriproducens]RDU22735.1 radical SAM protein [Anaerosacchariphilus polymeriproducens]
MRYEGRVFRPPSEAYSLIVQVTVGCSHNKCTFCDMYSEKQFHIRPMKDILEDFQMARDAYKYIGRVFLADGDALIRKTEDLLTILNFIKDKIPECERVTSYGTPKAVLNKTPEELKQLHDAGLQMIYMGLESGSDKVLEYVKKGETADSIVEAGLKVKEAGIKLSVTAISGLGGKAMWQEHAIKTAEAFTKMKPDYIGFLTLAMDGEVPLVQEWRAGRFAQLTPEEVAEEMLLFMEHVDSEGTIFRANHISNYVNLAGTLNKDKKMMIERLKLALDKKIPFKSEDVRNTI